MIVLGAVGFVLLFGGLFYVAWRKATRAAVVAAFVGMMLLGLWWTVDVFEETSVLTVLGRLGGGLVIAALLFLLAWNKPLLGVKEGAEENPPSVLWQVSVVAIGLALIALFRFGVGRLFG